MIYQGDCKDVDWSAGTVMVTDPPYSEHVHKKAISQSPGRGVRTRDLGFEHLSPELRLWTAGIAASIPRWSVIFSDIEGAHLWHRDLTASGATYVRTIPWVRWSQPQMSGDRPPSGCELVIIAYGKGKGRKSWNGAGNLTHFSHTCMRGEDKHRAQKPLDLMLDLVSWFSNPGDTIIDPFAGSGTTALASQLLGRPFMGAEIDPTWAVRATVREKSVPCMVERDQERYQRWLTSQEAFNIDKARRDANTAKTRAKLDAKAAATAAPAYVPEPYEEFV